MKSLNLLLISCYCVALFSGCNQSDSEDAPINKEIFYGKIVYTSSVKTDDSVFISNMSAISPNKIEIYCNDTLFRMIEYGGLSHGNIILNNNKKEAWQLNTENKIAYTGDYSDLGDPGADLKDLMPDHFRPIVEATTEKETILGHVCTKYNVLRSGFIPTDNQAYMWVADDMRFPSMRYDIQTEINHCAVPAPLIIGYEEGAILRLTVETKTYSRTYEVIELAKNDFPSGIFVLPEGYQKK